MSRSSGNKTLDIEKIYTSKRDAQLCGAGGGLGGEPAQIAPAKCFLSFWVSERAEAEDCASGKREKRLLRLKLCEGDF